MKAVNVWSFFAAILCILLFVITTFTKLITVTLFGIHPLTILLFLTIAILFIGIAGFAGVHDGKSLARSITTVIIASALAFVQFSLLFFGLILS
ncbi:hypothetical protein [Bacillus sp. AK031]